MGWGMGGSYLEVAVGAGDDERAEPRVRQRVHIRAILHLRCDARSMQRHESERFNVRNGGGEYARRDECSPTSSCTMGTDPFSAALMSAMSPSLSRLHVHI